VTQAESKPYTYIATSNKGGCSYGVSFYDARMRASAGVVAEEFRPYLFLGTRNVEVTVSTTGGGPVSLADVETAERILRAAKRYRDLIRLAHKRQMRAAEDSNEA
jgi:hypothetical protein